MLRLAPQSALLNPLDDFNLRDDDQPPPKWIGDWLSRLTQREQNLWPEGKSVGLVHL